MLNFQKYVNKKPYSLSKEAFGYFEKLNAIKEKSLTKSERDSEILQLKKDFSEANLKERDLYRKEANRLHQEFCQDCIADLGLEVFDKEKIDILLNYAWEKGHSHGYSEVYYYLIEISDLIFEFTKVN